jgi:predicted component of type VI protein secretion system
VLGSRFWDPSAAIRLDLGPISPLSIGSRRGAMPTALRALLGFLAGHKTDCEVHLLLAAAEVPPLRLATAGEARLA